MAEGDQLALYALYVRTYRPVFTWILRITGNRVAADDATLDVFHDVWRGAGAYDAAGGPVLAWVLNQARARALDRLVGARRGKRAGDPDGRWTEAEPMESAYFSLWKRLARRIAAETGRETVVSLRQPPEPEWEVVAPGLSCQFLAKDPEGAGVAMLVRMAPGAQYPAHTHAGVEQLYMFEGDLTVDDRKLRAGDYLRSDPGTTDRRVWTEAGCAGVLITSTRDILL
jgi:DNA-directed RNA polymerase specialized sigma24 family protein